MPYLLLRASRASHRTYKNHRFLLSTFNFHFLRRPCNGTLVFSSSLSWCFLATVLLFVSCCFCHGVAYRQISTIALVYTAQAYTPPVSVCFPLPPSSPHARNMMIFALLSCSFSLPLRYAQEFYVIHSGFFGSFFTAPLCTCTSTRRLFLFLPSRGRLSSSNLQSLRDYATQQHRAQDNKKTSLPCFH